MARQTETDRDEAAVAIMLRDVPETVRRISKSVNQDYDTDRPTVWLHNVGAVPIMREMRWIDRTRLEVAIDRNAPAKWEFLADLGTNACHNLVLLCEVAGPIRLVDLICAQFMRNEGVPQMQCGSVERPVRTECQQ